MKYLTAIFIFLSFNVYSQKNTDIGSNMPPIDTCGNCNYYECLPSVEQELELNHFTVDMDNWFIANVGEAPCRLIPQNPDNTNTQQLDGVPWVVSNMNEGGTCSSESSSFLIDPEETCSPDSVVAKFYIKYAESVKDENNAIDVGIWDGTTVLLSSIHENIMWADSTGSWVTVTWSGTDANALGNVDANIFVGWDTQNNSSNAIQYIELDYIKVEFFGTDCEYQIIDANPVSVDNLGECVVDDLRNLDEPRFNQDAQRNDILYSILTEMRKVDTICTGVAGQFELNGDCFLGVEYQCYLSGVLVDHYVIESLNLTRHEPNTLEIDCCGFCSAPASSVVTLNNFEVPLMCLDVHSYTVISSSRTGEVLSIENLFKSDASRLLAVPVTFLIQDNLTLDLYDLTAASPDPNVQFYIAGSNIRVEVQGPASADVTWTIISNSPAPINPYSFTVVDLDGAPSNERMTVTNDDFCSFSNGGTTTLTDNADGTSTIQGAGGGGLSANFSGIIQKDVTVINYSTDIGTRFFDHDISTSVPPVTDYVVTGFDANSTLDTPDNITFQITNIVGGFFYLISSNAVITSFTQQEVDDRLIGFQVTGLSGTTLKYDVQASDTLGGDSGAQTFTLLIP